ncbi:MAG: GIY-YIG nuclease family protein [Endomicrobium sp.]|jgi:hypothetical protein|nr:GIY-YIG nuclease family protein [Endomicrobium sp.]
MDRKKELKNAYKNTKTDMGIYKAYSKSSGKTWLGAAKDLKGIMNSLRFQLDLGSHPNKELQQEWNAFGGGNFEIEIIDVLKYCDDETKTDYSRDLECLLEIWKEKFACLTI